MTGFFQIASGVMIAVILGLAVSKQGKDMTLLLSMAVCCMVLVAAAGYLEPVLSFLESLQDLGKLDSGMTGVILKTVGIALVAEIASVICSDAGNAAMGKTVQTLAAAVILWLSLPMMQALVELIQQILEGT
jgi:stage III sporulation protein AD